MKTNLSITYSLLLLPLLASSSLLSMEKELTSSNKDKNPLEESVIVIKTPSQSGLGALDYLKDSLYGEAKNTLTALQNKTIDLDNLSWHNKINRTVVEYSKTKPDSNLLATMVALCRQDPYRGHIEVTTIPFRLAHKFLVQENKAKQGVFKASVEKNDNNFIQKFNTLFDDLQNIVSEKIKRMDEILQEHIKEQDTLVKEKGNEIRVFKKALVNLHHLNKEKNILCIENKEEDGYCSDTEIDADNVENSYNDEHLLKKIDVDYSMAQTKMNTENLLKKLYAISTNLDDLEEIKYKTT